MGTILLPVHRIECLMNVLIGHALGLHKAAAAGGEKSTSLMARDMVASDEGLGVTVADKRSSFTIARMEVSFRRATRAQFGEPRQWSASYPVPQELVLINVNGKSPTEVPPYCSSLFPQVTKLALVGMRYSWPGGVNYSNLKSLSLDVISAQGPECLSSSLQGSPDGAGTAWRRIRPRKFGACDHAFEVGELLYESPSDGGILFGTEYAGAKEAHAARLVLKATEPYAHCSNSTLTFTCPT
jgi:hypothetical protein